MTSPRVPFPGEPFLRRLRDVVGSAGLVTDPEALLPYARDETHGITPVAPDVVVLPASTREVREVLLACGASGVPVTPRGAGTGRAGGCVPVHGGVVLSLTRMDKVLEVCAGDLVAVAEPGVILGDFQDAVDRAGFLYPPDPASLASCTLGGTVAVNAGGPRALKYGVTRDHVLGLTAVLPTGEVLEVGRRAVKGVAGYDLTALLCGSEGTLAVITRVTVKLTPRPRAVRAALVSFPSSSAASGAVSAILGAGILPRTLEYLDRTSLEALGPVSGDALPPGTHAALVLETDGDEDDATLAVLARAADVASSHGATGVLVAQGEAQRRGLWDWRHRLSDAVKALARHKVSEDVAVPRSRIPELVARVGALGERHGLRTCSFGHAGDGNLHAQVLFDDENHRAAAHLCLRDIAVAAVELGGTITGEHGVGVAKRELLALEQGPEVLALQRRLKQAFDPRGILNPGKVLP